MAIRKQSAGHVQATLSVGDVEIGAVELKDAATDTRAKIVATGSITEGDIGVTVQAPVLGATTGAAVITDAAGTVQQYLRGIVRWAFERMPVSLGQKAMAASMPVVIANNQSAVAVDATGQAGEAHVGEVGASSTQVDVTPTITAGAYSVGDVIGGIQTIADAARVAGKCTTLDTMVITDLAMQDADIKIWFFNANPANGTYTDNGALDIHDTDLGFCIGVLYILSSDYDDATDNSVATLRNVGLKLTPAATSLFAIAEIETADTYTSTSDLTFKYSWSQD